MTADNRPETQAEAEELARGFMDAICRSDPATFNQMLSPELVGVDFEKRTLTLSMDFAGWMRNQVGIMHGGIIAAVADIVMGVLVYVFSGRKMPPTINLETNYMRMVNSGEKLYARAYADKIGRTTALMRCELWAGSASDKLTATASGVYSTAGKTYEEWLSGQ